MLNQEAVNALTNINKFTNEIREGKKFIRNAVLNLKKKKAKIVKRAAKIAALGLVEEHLDGIRINLQNNPSNFKKKGKNLQDERFDPLIKQKKMVLFIKV